MDFFILMVILAILLYVVLYFLKKNPTKEGFTSLTGSDYDYLAPVKLETVSDEFWSRLVDHYNEIMNTKLTTQAIKNMFDSFVTEDEINSYIQNSYFPYDNYLTNYFVNQYKTTYKGTEDPNKAAKDALMEFQKREPNRYLYSHYLANVEKKITPQPESYLIYIGELAPPNNINSIGSSIGSFFPGKNTSVEGGKDLSSNIDNTMSNVTVENKPPSKISFSGFFLDFFSQLLSLFVYTVFGTIILYTAKVSQTNLFPTDKNCEPYCFSQNAGYEEPLINVDIIKKNIFGGDINFWFGDLNKEDVLSNKIYFPYRENMKMLEESKLLGLSWMRDILNHKNCSSLTKYFISLHEAMYFNFASNINMVNNFINKTFSESVIVFLGTPIYGFIIFILFILNVMIGWVFYFYNLTDFFSKKELVEVEVLVNGKKERKNVINWSFQQDNINWFYFVFYLFIAFIFWGFAWGIMIPLLSMYIIFKVLLVPLFFSGKEDKTDENYSYSRLLKNFLFYKKSLYMYIISIYIISAAMNHLGTTGFVYSIIACVIAYWFFPGIYQKCIPDVKHSSLSYGLVSYENAKRKCKEVILKHLGPVLSDKEQRSEERHFYQQMIKDKFNNKLEKVVDEDLDKKLGEREAKKNIYGFQKEAESFSEMEESNEIGEPAQELEAPAQELEATPQELEATPQELEAPAQELEAPTQELEAPAQELEAPEREVEQKIIESKTGGGNRNKKVKK